MTITLLIDNDVVVKLAQLDAYSDGLAGLGAKPSEVGSLGVMLRYMGLVDAQKRLRITKGQQEADRLALALQTITDVKLRDEEAAAAAATLKSILESDGDIDVQEGELLLLTVAAMRGGMEVATGDKRALRSLPRLEAIWSGASVLRKRIVCFEQIFKCICKISGLARVTAAIRLSPQADKTITYIHSETHAKGAGMFVQAINYVVDEQIEKLAPGWLKPL